MLKIRIHWKSLLGYGVIFWLLMCIFRNETPKHVMNRIEIDEDNENSILNDIFPQKFEEENFDINSKLFKFGWSLFVWNAVTFLLSFSFCYWARTISRICFGIYLKIINKKILLKMDPSLVKTPVIVKHHNTQLSDTHIEIKPKINSDLSCPNLLSKRTASSLSHQTAPNTKCQTIYKNNKLFPLQRAEDLKFNKLMENQCAKLREEMAKLQGASIKERAILSRKLESVTKEKRELSKHLAFVQKENRGAKQELEELLQEKTNLLKRVENATKELRANNKTKKIALTKLEEATTTTDNLKRELEQMTRDKEILESKMKVLQEEYEKLQERVLSCKSSYENNDFHGQTPERDVYSNNNPHYENRQNQTEYDVVEYSPRNKLPVLSASVTSCTGFDMRNIEIEIRRLERNLDNLSSPRRDNDDSRFCEGESDASLSYRENTSRSLKSENDLHQENRLINSTKLKYWGGKAGDMVNAIANKMNEKVRFLHNIHERNQEESTEIDEYDPSCPESLDDIHPPKKIVSGSLAFQNFLRSLQPGECVRRQFMSQSDIRF